MTKRERAQAVEFLRCVYDSAHAERAEGTSINCPARAWRYAIDAVKATRRDVGALGLRDAFLEAAIRVEQGELP